MLGCLSLLILINTYGLEVHKGREMEMFVKGSLLSIRSAAFGQCVECQNLRRNCWMIAADFGANLRLTGVGLYFRILKMVIQEM